MRKQLVQGGMQRHSRAAAAAAAVPQLLAARPRASGHPSCLPTSQCACGCREAALGPGSGPGCAPPALCRPCRVQPPAQQHAEAVLTLHGGRQLLQAAPARK